MDENTRSQMTKLVSGLKALRNSSTSAMHTGKYNDSTADMLVRTFNKLYEKAVELMPEDDYIVDVLALELDENADAEDKVFGVHLATEQLHAYVRDQMRMEWMDFSEDVSELRRVGRDLQQQIMTTTRTALRRALGNLENLDFDVNVGVDVEGDGGVKVKTGNMPKPPKPPKPPTPPKRARKVAIAIETDDDDTDDENEVFENDEDTPDNVV